MAHVDLQIKGITEVSAGKTRHFGFTGYAADNTPVPEQSDASTSKNITDLLKGIWHQRAAYPSYLLMQQQ